MNANYTLHDGKHGAAFTVRVTPRARRTEISDIIENGTVRVRVAAPTRDGEANRKLLAFLAEVLDIDLSRLEIVAGENGLDKIISVLDMPSDVAEKKLEHWLENQEKDSSKQG